MTLKAKSAWSVLILQLLFIIIFGIFGKYGSDLDASDPKHNKRISDGESKPKENTFNHNYPSKFTSVECAVIYLVNSFFSSINLIININTNERFRL